MPRSRPNSIAKLVESVLRACTSPYSPLFDRPDRLLDGILQVVQAQAHVRLGLPIALLLVVELLAKLLDGHRAADRAPVGAVGLRLAQQQCAVRQRNPRSHGEHAPCWFALGDLSWSVGLRFGW